MGKNGQETWYSTGAPCGCEISYRVNEPAERCNSHQDLFMKSQVLCGVKEMA